MILPQSPDDEESADDTPGPDLCTLFDDYWGALRREPGSDLRQRLIDREPAGDSIASELDFLNRLHQLRSVSLPGGGASQVATAWLSESIAIEARSRSRDTGAEASPAGREGQATVDEPLKIGKYLVLEKLGSGGQAQVFRVVHRELAKEYVLKLAHRPKAIEDRADRDALRQEGRLLAQCEHHNLVRVVNLDVHEGRWFIVMEHISALTLDQFVAQRRPEPRRAARIVLELAQAVAYLHAHKITHQDIKPQNVLVDDLDRPRLIDFGLARLKYAWREGVDDGTGGTARYMSPEQAEGRADLIGPRTDVFGLGGLLYHMLTGRPLYVGASRASTIRLARAAAYIPVRRLNPRVPRSLERICHKALAADPDRRYASAVELGRALKRSLERRRIAAASLIVLFLVAAVLFVPRLWPRSANPDPTLIPPTLAFHAEAPTPQVAPKIVSFKVDARRGKSLKPLGPLGSEPILEGDRIFVTGEFDTSVSCYVIALQTDGKDQLCLPSDKSDLPGRSTRIKSYPWAFPLTDGPGLQAFVVVASRKQLPPFEEWKGREGMRKHWTKVAADDLHGAWEFKDGELRPISSMSRGPLVKITERDPLPFQRLCEYLEKLSDIEVIRGIAFVVEPKK